MTFTLTIRADLSSSLQAPSSACILRFGAGTLPPAIADAYIQFSFGPLNAKSQKDGQTHEYQARILAHPALGCTGLHTYPVRFPIGAIAIPDNSTTSHKEEKP